MGARPGPKDQQVEGRFTWSSSSFR